MRKCRGRIVASILALALVLTSGGLSVLAEGENSQQPANVSEEQQEAAGQSETDPEQESQPGEETESTGKQPAEEQTTEGQSDESSSVVISQWSWIDEDGILQEDNGVWGIGMPGASEENPLTQDALSAMLPSQIQAVTANGETVTLDITWDLSAIPAEGIWSGEQVFTASLPEGYQMADGVSGLSVTVQLGGAETLTIPTGTVDTAPFQHSIVENTTETPGTTINLFDYWLQERDSDDNPDPGNVADLGINANHALNFRASGGNDYRGEWNDYTNGLNPRQGIVADTLGEDGYPRLNDLNTGRGGRDGNESLSYLFDPEVDHEGKASFKDVDGLLQVDGDGYYYYNSEANYAAFYPDSNAFALYTKPGVPTSTTSGEFFPFNSAADVFGETNWGTDIEPSTTNYDNMNHYFGVSMSTRFIQQYGGHTSDDRSKEVTYEFSGDDDVWVFIDDVLVADLGGIHGAASLSINFATGRVQVQGQRPVTLREQFRNAGVDTSDFYRDTFADDTYHTLKFFYLERGNSASNMSLKFNLVTVPESDIIKVDQLGNPVAGAEFELYAANREYEILGEAPIATGTTDESGSFILVDDEGYTVSLNDLYTQGIHYLVLRETKVPDGYRSSGDMHLYMYQGNTGVDGNIVLLSDNHWETGAYASAKLTAKAPSNVVTDYPIADGQGVMFAVAMKYVGEGTPDLGKLNDWRPISGDPVYDDWQVADDSSMESILEAAKANPYSFQIDSSGAYKVEIENLPGDIKNYYFMLPRSQKDQTDFAVMYFYVPGVSSINQITNPGAITHITETEGSDREFSREFAVRLYVPNIKNYLLVQKVDDQGNPVTGATFTLYTENPDVNPNAPVHDTVTTSDLSKEQGAPIDLEGGGIFPTEEGNLQDDILPAGTYYLKETAAPGGYKQNDTVTEIVVDNTGVYANAGAESDGVDVLRGVGSIVKTMVQFATDDNLNSTLHDIKASLQTSDSYSGDNTTWTGTGQETHLQYGNTGAALEYGPVTIDGQLTPLALETSTGWSRLVINQCLAHTEDNIGGIREDLGNDPITALFSGTVTVRVTNERVGSLTISKAVVDETNTAPANDEFTFTLTGSDSNEYPLQGSFTADGSGAPQDRRVTFINGTAEVTLSDGEDITILQLPDGAVISVEEAQKDGYTTTYKVNGGDEQTGSAATNLTINYNAGVNVAFTNTYIPMGEFEFLKTDKNGRPLEGATFALYHLECTDPGTHDHNAEEISVDEDGNPVSACWKLTATATSVSGTGQVRFTSIPIEGEYRLVEIKVPDGYVNPGGQWKIEYRDGKFQPKGGEDASVGNPPAIKVDDTGDTVTYSIINYQPGELPFSGNTGIKMFLIIGGILMAAGAAGTIWYLRRKRRLA